MRMKLLSLSKRGCHTAEELLRLSTRLLTLQGYAANSVARGSWSTSRDEVKKPDVAEWEQNSEELELNKHLLACVSS